MIIYDGNNQSRIMWETDMWPMRKIASTANEAHEVCIWAWDGFGANDRRRAFFPGYKIKKDSEKAPNEFYKTIKQIKKMMAYTNAIQIECQGYEADDVIASVVANWDRKERVHIMSTDRDLQVLKLLPNVTTSQTPLPNVELTDMQLYKTLVGDSSDKIPGLPGFGKKAWEEVDKAAMRRFLTGETTEVPVQSLSTRCANWLLVEENVALLKGMWKCIELIDVPESDIVKGMKVGVRNDNTAEAIRKEFLQ